MNSTLIDGCYYVLKLLMEILVLSQVKVKPYFAPLSPHDVSLVEIKPYDSLLVLFVSLDMMPPESLFHQTLDKLVVVANANLVLIKRGHLTKDQMVLR